MIGTIIKPAIKKTDYVKRNIVEFCCRENPKIGKSKYQRDGCSVTRFTLEDDVITNQGLYKSIEAVAVGLIIAFCGHQFHAPVDRAGKIRINSKTPGGPERIKEHKRLFDKVWISLKNVAKERHKHGGRIAIEWPKGREYWRTKHVKQYTQDLKLNKVHINGCALGLIDSEGIPILKPWAIATDDPYG